MAAPVTTEKVVYLLDPIGASRRSRTLRVADAAIRAAEVGLALRGRRRPAALHPPLPPQGRRAACSPSASSTSGSARQVMATGAGADLAGHAGGRAADRGRPRRRRAPGRPGHRPRRATPTAGFMPGMDIHARADRGRRRPGRRRRPAARRAVRPARGPPAARVGRRHEDGRRPARSIAGSSPAPCSTPSATRNPEIFGFLYVHPDRVASLGIFVPSWFDSPVRTAYRYLQHWMLHPYLWRYLKGGTLRSWGAKSLQESGRRGEPYLAGDGYARIGEGSGSTNVLTGSGVDEAWTTGVQLAEGVIELLQGRQAVHAGEPRARPTSRGAGRAGWRRRRASPKHARDGFQRGVCHRPARHGADRPDRRAV